VVAPYDRNAVGAVEKALRNSDLGVNPSSDGTVVRLVFPPLTAERRKDLVKVVRHLAEEGRVAVRNLRRSARHDLEALEKEGEVSADDVDRAAKELDRLTASAVSDIDTALEHKERELLEG
jgi:ribosome recycling factor